MTKKDHKKKSIILLSGGMDSTVNLAVANLKTNVVLALTFNYGQRAALKEINSAKKSCQHFKIPHQVIDLKWLKNLGSSSLTNLQLQVPSGTAIVIDDLKTSEKTAKSVWIPNRNGLFLNVAAAFAESCQADIIIPGFNAEEAKTFPDNSLAFIKKATTALAYSTQNKVKVRCFTISLDKTEIVRLGLKYKAPFHLMWPCYFNLKKWCGQCESCQRANRALNANGVTLESLQ